MEARLCGIALTWNRASVVALLWCPMPLKWEICPVVQILGFALARKD